MNHLNNHSEETPETTSYLAVGLQVATQSVNSLSVSEAREVILAGIPRLEEHVRGALGWNGPTCRLVVLPEYVLTGFPLGESVPEWVDKAALEPGGREYELLGEIASKHNIFLAINAYESDPAFPGLYFQGNVILGPNGDEILRYRRLHSLYSPSPYDVLDAYVEAYGEDSLFPVVRTEIGALAAVASEEILYPELSRMFGLRGAEVFVHPTSEISSPELTPKAIARRARAIENMAYVVSANSGGLRGISIPSDSTNGGSEIIDYTGRRLAVAGPGESIVATAEIDIAAVRRNRKKAGMANLPARVKAQLWAEQYARHDLERPNLLADRQPERALFMQRQAEVLERLERGGPAVKLGSEEGATMVNPIPDTYADAALKVSDPRTGEEERNLKPPSGEALLQIASELRQNQAAWRERTAEERAQVLLEWHSHISEARDDLVEALTADTGRKIESIMEVEAVLGMLTRWAKDAPAILAPKEDTQASMPGMVISGELHPYPLIGVISPWNFPLLLGVIDAIPALAAGSAVLAKPSEVTPRFITPLMETISRVGGLRGVLHIVEGAAAVGAAIPDLVDLVVFTGSVPTGRRVGEAAMRAFIPSFLELGGKDPAIVMDGADLDRASSALLWGSTANSGQSCLSIERIYVQESIYDEFLHLFVEKASRLGTAHESVDAAGVGPLIDPEQGAVIQEQFEDAVSRGARIHTGGRLERHGGGTWCPPTVITDVDPDMLVAREETFGPVVTVTPVADARAAVERANDTQYGLSAAVFAKDEQTARAIAKELRFGAVSINDAGLTSFLHEGEKDSFGLSGLGGSRMGPASLRRFLRRQAHLINRSTQPDPWWWADT